MVINKIDEDRILSSHDVIVIGAGLGGLGAACQLALAKEDVLLLEKHNVPGGFATSFVRGRFEFEGALHEMSGVGTKENPGSLYKFFNQIGLLPDVVKFTYVKEIYRSVFFDGYDVTMPFGVQQYFDKLIELFPSEKQGIHKFLEVCEKVDAGLSYVEAQGGQIKPLAVLMKHSWLARVAGHPIGELFKRYFKDKRLISVLAQLWGYTGQPPSRMNAILFIAMYMSYLKRGAAFPIGRSHALTSGMLKCFQKLGGEVKFNSLVNRILLDENQNIYGVELLNGDIHRCKAIISNVNPICTTMKMLPEEGISDTYKKKIYAPEIGPSAFSVYIGLNAPADELGLTAHETFINKDDDHDKAYETFGKLQAPGHIVAACYNHVYKDISPPGTSQLVLTTLQFGRAWYNVAPDQYHRIKDKIADSMVSIVEKTISPNIREHIEIAEAATPLTYYRYSKALDGAIYGYVQDVHGNPLFRLKSKGPIPRLYFSGAWTNIGGGFSPCIDSGRIAASLYLNDKKQKEGI
jgi:phytoene dehydrogenase-like protein